MPGNVLAIGGAASRGLAILHDLSCGLHQLKCLKAKFLTGKQNISDDRDSPARVHVANW
jgi:hypothetical protein